jgi:DeoR/GlpR family transcriptional regulator of sugar metabolism
MKANANSRQRDILEHLAREGVAPVSKLGDLLNVSEMMVRRDLVQLDQDGLLERVYGGATATDKAFFRFSMKGKASRVPMKRPG